MHVDALITDLDGTFWSPTMEIHPESMAVVSALDDCDVPFVVATGRRAQGALKGLVPVGLHNRPAILMNGALARDTLAGDSFLVDGISYEQANEILGVFRSVDLEPVVYIDHPTTDMLVGPGSAAGEEYLASASGYERVESLDASLTDSSIIGFGAFGYAYELLAPIAEQVNGDALATAIIGVSHFEGDHGIMIQAHAVDKWTGITAWCERANVDLGRLAVVGDGHNDIDMLTGAKIAIVPSNAPDEIKALADAIIEPNEEGGWEQIPGILGM